MTCSMKGVARCVPRYSLGRSSGGHRRQSVHTWGRQERRDGGNGCGRCLPERKCGPFRPLPPPGQASSLDARRPAPVTGPVTQSASCSAEARRALPLLPRGAAQYSLPGRRGPSPEPSGWAHQVCRAPSLARYFPLTSPETSSGTWAPVLNA